MRKAIVTFLLAVLPFQFVWGAAAEYCQHEGGDQVSHFGHHIHMHGQNTADSSSHGTSDGKGQPAADDADCICCHLSCASPLPAPLVTISVDEAGQPFAQLCTAHAALFAAAIDRPNWALLS